MEFSHIPVMLNECIDGLNVKPNGTYVDCTMGGAGHSSVIADKLSSEGTLICIDKDIEAIQVGKERLKDKKPKIIFVNEDFKNYKSILAENGIEKVDGVLIDLGVSSYQIDNTERGFSYRFDAPLDMRMDKSQSLSAYEVVNSYSYEELIKILFEYGEEDFAKSIARNIIKTRETKNIETTGELVKIIESSVPSKVLHKGGSVAKKTFQAIRIEVNGELADLDRALKEMIFSLNKGGRLVVLTFHSLEDRIVKNVFKDESTGCICPKELPICVCHHKEVVKLINKKPIVASESELKVNSRSTSAKLRIVEKL